MFSSGRPMAELVMMKMYVIRQEYGSEATLLAGPAQRGVGQDAAGVAHDFHHVSVAQRARVVARHRQRPRN